MALPGRISLVTLGARDVAALTAFYQGLGWPKSSASVADQVSFFDTVGARLAIYSLDDLCRDIGADPPDPKAFRGLTLAINLDSEAAVNAAIDAVTVGGGQVVTPPAATDWGGYNATFADPEGNLWEVAHNPGWPLDAEGLPQLPR